ncbi:hypothetical protein [Butyrivibrio sp. VCB2006]|uniref:hypothetical protein n=1 Tax=Butyrivibrio sp. VCB2006 TaxID=1280679 RepID=UPI000429312B|nr:hypothetical protein [Butyrivibrio sp. VCB2006]
MKRLKKHVVIGTTAGITGLFLTACAAYGPAPSPAVIPDNTEGASMEMSINDENAKKPTADDSASESSSATPISAATESGTADAASEASASAASTNKVSFSEVGEVSGEDAIGAMNSASLDTSELEFFNPKDNPIPTVYGPPVESK